MLLEALGIAKYLSGCMASLSAMIQLELPHVNILMKMDLVENKKEIEKFLDPDTRLLLDLNQHMTPHFAKLNRSLAELIDDYRRCKVNAANKLLPHMPPHLQRSCGVSNGIAKDLPVGCEDEKRGYRDKWSPANTHLFLHVMVHVVCKGPPMACGDWRRSMVDHVVMEGLQSNRSKWVFPPNSTMASILFPV
ncbi:hypothetical protein SUGI_0506990 [Cryptomeria japonica]|nr:hypothetical protein SUGI_0506990 [Cryptomeria japonica]